MALKINEKFTVKSIVNRAIPRRDGNGDFTFTEVELESVDKRPVTVIARLQNDDMQENIKVGGTYALTLYVTSSKSQDGRVFNNFTIGAIVSTFEEPKEEKKEEPEDNENFLDEIPF